MGSRATNARASHGFFTRDGAAPELLRSEGLSQLRPYAVDVEVAHVTGARPIEGGFKVSAGRKTWVGRKLLLATGMREHDAQIPGVVESLGRGVFSCPYCDGWEVRDLALGILATGADAAESALGLCSWSSNVTLFTHGSSAVNDDERARLSRNGVRAIETRIERVVPGHDLRLRGVQLVDGRFVALDALFLHAGQFQHSVLAEACGCELETPTVVKTDGYQQTNVSGLYVAGDAAAHVESIAVAAADGYRAAVAIHRELRRERTK